MVANLGNEGIQKQKRSHLETTAQQRRKILVSPLGIYTKRPLRSPARTKAPPWWRLVTSGWAQDSCSTALLLQFSPVQSLSRVQVFAIPLAAAGQASLSITNSRSSLKLTSIESVMPSNHLILCRPLNSPKTNQKKVTHSEAPTPNSAYKNFSLKTTRESGVWGHEPLVFLACLCSKLWCFSWFGCVVHGA